MQYRNGHKQFEWNIWLTMWGGTKWSQNYKIF